MFAVFGVDRKEVEARFRKKGGTDEVLKQRIDGYFKRKKKGKIRVSPIYSNPNLCKQVIEILKKDPNYSEVEIRHYLHHLVTVKGKTRLKKGWLKYRGEASNLELIANNRKK